MKKPHLQFLLLLLLFVSCQRHVETPLQILIAESMVENNSDAQYALYLLGEVEDTIAFYPDSIQMRYRLAQAMAQNAKGEAIDSLLPPLTAWFDAHGPAKEAARAHHLAALSLLQQNRMEEARHELSLALKADPSYKASLFLTAYLALYTGAYTEALEHFMRIERNERSNYSVLQGAYALRSSLGSNHSDFAQAMQGEELETARQMLTDMEFCLRYFQEHPDDSTDIIRRCAVARDSLLHSQTSQPPLGGETSKAQAKKELPLKGVGGSVIGGILTAFVLLTVLWMMFRRRRKPMAEPVAVFNEVVQRMEKLSDHGQQPAAEEWEQLHVFVRDRYPHLVQSLAGQSLTRSEMQMCLLSAVDLRQKQVASLLGISPQNLRNQRLRLLARLDVQPCESVADFTAWIQKIRGTSKP